MLGIICKIKHSDVCLCLTVYPYVPNLHTAFINHISIANEDITQILSISILLAKAESIKSKIPVDAPTIAKIINCLIIFTPIYYVFTIFIQNLFLLSQFFLQNILLFFIINRCIKYFIFTSLIFR